jgi:hypothetical protein
MQNTNDLSVRYDHKLETIQDEYLKKHFQQLCIVLSKHYHYSFQIIKYLSKLQTSKQ